MYPSAISNVSLWFQSLYYSYYYDDPMSDGGAFPMETQVLMQEVLTDGLAFCSLM